MPELPEVETIRRQLDTLLTGSRLEEAWAVPDPKVQAATRAVHATVTSVHRRGKYLLLALDDRHELIIHLGMTGTLEITDTLPTDRHLLRAWWRLGDGRALLFRDQRTFGRISVVPTGDHTSLPTLHALGPEPFDAHLTGDRLYHALRASRSPVKVQLLGQRVVAGVGNIYADEALWNAAIAPTATRVGRTRAHDLLDAIRTVLSDAIDHGGTRLRDYRSIDGDTGTHQHHLDCYGRAGQPCRRCGTILSHRTLGGRGTTWCRHCQRR